MPRDLLGRIADQDPELGGLTSEAFHLAPGERLGEAIARSWARLTGAWTVFSEERDKLNDGDTTGRMTRERWLLPLFSELGYGRLVQRPAVEFGDRHFAVFSEFQHSPLHLVGAGVPLDRRTAGVRGAAEQSPHSLVQELLNRSDDRLWGIVTNGLSLRLLRDNVTLTRQAYVEWDLESILAGEAYEDFALLWLCCHQSRLEAERPEDCWLERWTQIAERDGTRALDTLRDGVERAIEELGRGFLAHRANTGLQSALEAGAVDGQDYYRQLLRLVYRLLFCFVAEDRDVLLLAEDGTAERRDARAYFTDYYGTARIRRLAGRRRGGRAHDLYEQLKLLFGWLHADGQPVLALPPLGSALWDPATTPLLAAAQIDNEHLLEAVRRLAYVDGGRRPVDFRHLGAEELGSIYESLLELHPELDRTTATFDLTTAAGHERKQTGSYYTPSSLIGSLLETALDPVIDQAVALGDPEQALLDLRVCDPACGSGHFLIAAANRIAKRLAALREQDPEPSPTATRHALRDVVSRCIYAVDVNPMAVELCKVSLWLEALEPGRPLSFLEDRVVCGNSLLGTTPALLADGVPDEAYKRLLGDDGPTVAAWKKRNRQERGQLSLDELAAMDADEARLAELAGAVRAAGDRSLAEVREAERRFEALLGSPEHEHARWAADTWCTAFVAPKGRGDVPITQDAVRRAACSGAAGLSDEERAVVERARAEQGLFHWHVAFPEAYAAGGFDCVLGNPPWERVKLQEKEWFATRSPEIAAAPTKAAREKLINALEDEDPPLWNAWQSARRGAEAASVLLRASGRYPLCGRGDVNTYSVFAEGMRAMLGPRGRVGVIVPTGIATDDTTKHFFADLVERRSLVSLFSFENEERVFAGVHNQFKFCLLTLRASATDAPDPQFVFFARRITDLMDDWRRFSLAPEDLALLNPNTGTCPTFRSGRDADLAKHLAQVAPPLVRDGTSDGDPWGVRFRAMFHMANDSRRFSSDPRGRLPLYEGKLFWQFDHRYSTYEGATQAQLNKGTLPRVDDQKHENPDFAVAVRYWVRVGEVETAAADQPPWFLAFRDVTNSVSQRTWICTALPRTAVGHKAPLIGLPERTVRERLAFLACANALAVDYAVRQKVGGAGLPLFALKQVPFPTPAMLAEPCPWDPSTSQVTWLSDRALELTYTAHDLDAIADEDPSLPGPFRWIPERREANRAELDGALLHLYGLDRQDAEHILDSFAVQRKYDEAEHGEFRTKRLVLERYDALAEAIASGRPYVTPLDPPPGDARATHATQAVSAP